VAIHSYPWYFADWRSSEAVMAMTSEERGIYRELLDYCWEAGSLPADERLLQRMSLATDAEWRRSWSVVRQMFAERDGRLWHAKVDERRPELMRWHESRRAAGRKGADRRWRREGDGQDNGTATDEANGSANDLASSSANSTANSTASGTANGLANGLANGEANSSAIAQPIAKRWPSTSTSTYTYNPPIIPPTDSEDQDLPLDDWVERLYRRHPKKKNKALVPPALWAAVSGAPDPAAKFAEIDRAHEIACRSYGWRKEGGMYAPKLDEWLADEGYTAVQEEERDPGDLPEWTPSYDA